MNVKQEQICRLCLKLIINGHEEIDEVMKQMFDVLLLKFDLDITRDPIICMDCIEVAKKCLGFKFTCINTEQIILSYSTGRKDMKYSIKVLYDETECVRTVFDGDLDICRFCMMQIERNNFSSLDTLITAVTDMSVYLPEMDFNTIESPVACTTCRGSLEDYHRFFMHCLDIEEKIKSYCKEKGTDSTGQVKLVNIMHFLYNKIPVSETKIPKYAVEDAECVYPEIYSRLIRLKESDIKEELDLEENSHKNLPNIYDDMFPLQICNNETKPNMVSVEAEDKKECVSRQILIQNSSSDLLRPVESLKYKCSFCAYETKQKYHLTKHLATHKDISEIKIYKCTLCAYETKRKDSLNTHMLVHKDVPELNMYKCTFCAFETKHKSNLTKHSVIHKDISLIKMYICSLCPYESRYKRNYANHMLVHKDVSELKMYKCSVCPYETKQKRYLTSHMVIHKDISEVEMYKCSFCPHETKFKRSLTNHMLIHKDVSELKMYKCTFCAYETRHKCRLTEHLLIHKDVAEIKMYKCSLCTFETKVKGRLSKHMIVHKDVSEVEMYKCSLCAYETKRKHNLKPHMLVHKDVSELNMYKCSFCAFKTKYKSSLKVHSVIHRDISKIK